MAARGCGKFSLYIYTFIVKYHLMYVLVFCYPNITVSKGPKIRNRYNQAPHLTQDINGKVTNAQLDTTNESQEVSPFLAGDHKAHINRAVLWCGYEMTTIYFTI